jgi:hypothetical protein
LISQARGITPIQVQNAIGWAVGEINWFDAISKGAGFYTSTTYPKKDDNKWDQRLKEYKQDVAKIMREYNESDDKTKFRSERGKELAQYRKTNKFQSRLNKLRRVANKLGGLKETPSRLKRIEQLENRRTELIKNYLSKGERL